MNMHFFIGVLAALFATLGWSLNFIIPYIVGEYTVYDLIFVRFLFSAVLGVALMLFYRSEILSLDYTDFLVAFFLGFIGYAGYLVCVVGGVVFAGPVISPAFLGLVPIFLAVFSNASRKLVSWRKLKVPLLLAVIGLVLINMGSLLLPSADYEGSMFIGILFSVSAVLVWIFFSIFNQFALEKRPTMNSVVWTALMMTGAGVGVLLFYPVGLSLGLFKLSELGADIASAGHVYLWAFMLATISSVLGAWAWNVATRRLPMVLTGQLISVETIFATTFGLLANQRFPTMYELLGIMMLIAGATIAVRIFIGPRDIKEGLN